MITRRAFIASTATTGAALALAACAPAPSPSASSATSAIAGAPTKTTWTVALDFKINAIDLGITDEWRGVIGHFYEPLVDTVGFDFQLVPRLATSWERTDDLTWRFHLRQGIKFHDGKEMTADDVDYSVRAYAEPTHPMNYRVPWFVQSKVVDKYTIDFTTKTPNLAAVWDFCRLYVMSKAAREADVKGFNEHPVGTGPFQVDNWNPGDRLTLKAFPDYWRGKVKPETLIFREIPDVQTAAAELATGGVDLVRNVDYLQVASIKQNPDLDITSVKGGTLLYTYFRVDAPPLSDRRVRQAMNYALDRQTLISQVLFGLAAPVAGPFPQGFRGYDPNLKPYSYDVGQAKQLLADAGFANGFKTQWGLSLDNTPSPVFKQLYEAAAAQLEKVGVQVEIVPYKGLHTSCDQQAPLDSGVWGLTSDPLTYLSAGYTKPGTCHLVPEASALLDKAIAQPTYNDRTTALQEFGRKFHDEAIELELAAYDFLVGKRKDLDYKVSVFANGAGYVQWFDEGSLKPLSA